VRRSFAPRYQKQRYCSQACGTKHDNRNRKPKPEKRKVPRPPYEQLIAEVRATNYSAVGRKYGVSDHSVRKWIQWYESQREMGARRGGEDQAA
jgi:DNA invertase Pin-like site-specific DNA recombinase